MRFGWLQGFFRRLHQARRRFARSRSEFANKLLFFILPVPNKRVVPSHPKVVPLKPTQSDLHTHHYNTEFLTNCPLSRQLPISSAVLSFFAHTNVIKMGSFLSCMLSPPTHAPTTDSASSGGYTRQLFFERHCAAHRLGKYLAPLLDGMDFCANFHLHSSLLSLSCASTQDGNDTPE